MKLRRPRRHHPDPSARVRVRVTCGGAVASEAKLSDVLDVLYDTGLGVFVIYDAGPPDARVAVYLTLEGSDERG